MECEKRKQDIINLEKELIKVRDQLETKTRDLIVTQELASHNSEKGEQMADYQQL